MARYTRSTLGLVPPDESEFNHRYRFSQNQKEVPSLFSNNFKFQTGNDSPDGPDERNGQGQFQGPLDFEGLHNDEKYDLSTKNVIEQLKNTPMKLKYADFAYCKNYGVYPNNRLIVVRRFGGPVGDNLFKGGGSPIATVVTWFDDQNPPVSIDFGINWEDAEGSYKSVLNSIGNDFGLGRIGINLGDAAAGGFALFPLPGAFEPLTRNVLQNLGLISGDSSFIPAGSGTLIKEAKKRKTIPEENTGSSINGKITVAVKCSWEQKFIGGIDPTPVYFDLLRTILHFGSDDASFYMGGGSAVDALVKKLLQFLRDPVGFIKTILAGIVKAFGAVVKAIRKVIDKYYDQFIQKIPQRTDEPEFETDESGGLSEQGKKDKKAYEDKKLADEQKKVQGENDKVNKEKSSLLDPIFDAFTNTSKLIGNGVANKYRHALMGISAALSGAPSTPWHVTVGNPFRPILSSGDMYMESGCKLTLGPNLAFNDLPSSIDLEFTLTSARNLGAQEIFRKLTAGEIRFSTKIPANFYQEFEGDKYMGVSQSGGPGYDNFRGPLPPTDARQEDLATPVEPQFLNNLGLQSNVGNNGNGLSFSNGTQVNPDPNNPNLINGVQGSGITGTPSVATGVTPSVAPGLTPSVVQPPPPGSTPSVATGAPPAQQPNTDKYTYKITQTGAKRTIQVFRLASALTTETQVLSFFLFNDEDAGIIETTAVDSKLISDAKASLDPTGQNPAIQGMTPK